MHFIGAWNFAQKSLALGGAMYLANAMRGVANFRAAFPVGVVIAYLGQHLPGISPGAAWHQPPLANWIFYTSAAFTSGANAMIMTVHELAHVWAASSAVDEGFFKAAAGQQYPTKYASTNAAEWFAESVTVAVFGKTIWDHCAPGQMSGHTCWDLASPTTITSASTLLSTLPQYDIKERGWKADQWYEEV
jgi:hypothetical protein